MLLASMVFHSDWLLSMCAKYPDHSFHSIPVLNDLTLIQELKNNHLTLEPNKHVPIATGVLHQVAHARSLKQVNDKCDAIYEGQQSVREDLNQAVSDAVDEKVASEGGVNLSIMNSSLDSLKNDILSRLESLTITTKGLSQLIAPAVEPEPGTEGKGCNLHNRHLVSQDQAKCS